MNKKGIKPVSEQVLQFKPTENNSYKAYYKEAPSKDKVNLVIYNEDLSPKNRNNLFVVDDLHQ